MKDPSNRRPSHRREGAKKTKRSALSKRILFCCCLMAAALALDLFLIGLLLTPERRSGVSYPPLPGSVTFYTGSLDGSRSDEDPQDPSWSLILVNRWNPIPRDYEIQLAELPNGQAVDRRVYSPLQELLEAARADGVYPVVVSGYRTPEEQQALLDEKIVQYRNEGYPYEAAVEKAEAWVAVPGTSEHQLGLSVDLNPDRSYSTAQEVYQWLEENGARFGFIRRYPSDKTDLTGVIDEPWHYRYVGAEAAAVIQEEGLCLEEYLQER